MRLSCTKAITLAISAALVQAVIVPDVVPADTDLKLDLSSDLRISSTEGVHDSYRVYLSILLQTDFGTYGEYLSCFLVRLAPTSVTEQTVRIPSSIGPDEKAYSISFMSLNKSDISTDRDSGFETIDYYNVTEADGNVFALSGGTGSWGEAEIRRVPGSDPDNVPCSAYGCARNCSETFWNEDGSEIMINGVPYATAERSVWDCIRECPGVTYPTWNVLRQVNVDLSHLVTTTVTESPRTETVYSTSTSYPSTNSTPLATPSSFPNSTVTSASTSHLSTGSSGTSLSTPTVANTPSPTPNWGSQVVATNFTLFFAAFLVVLAASSA